MTDEERRIRQRQATARWRAKHPEKVAASQIARAQYHRDYKKMWRLANRDRVLIKNQEESSKQKLKRKDKKLFLINKFGRSCVKCGYRRCQFALEFHHKNPKQKQFEVSGKNLGRYSIESLLVEAEKCDLLCVNCHREIHFFNPSR